MKILSIALLIVGAVINFGSETISRKLFGEAENLQNKKLMIKLIGLAVVIVAAIVAFCS